jgi:hypothetical protein
MTNSPSTGMKTSIEPATTPGRESGNVTCQKLRSGGEPRSAAASSRLPSSLSSAA